MFDIAFVVDSSDSIGRFNWFIKKQFIKRIVESFQISEKSVHVAIVVYSNNAEIVLKFDTLTGGNINSNKVNGYIDKMEWRKGFTFIDKALDLTDRSIFDPKAGMRTNVPKVRMRLLVQLIVISNNGTGIKGY